MNVEKIKLDLMSMDFPRIRESGLKIIHNSQNDEIVKLFISSIWQIKKETEGKQLINDFSNNIRFITFSIEILEFHEQRNLTRSLDKKCTCRLYLSKSYKYFNPRVEIKNESIKLILEVKGITVNPHLIECLKCNSAFYVSGRQRHSSVWWIWSEIADNIELNESGNSDIDNELKYLFSRIKLILEKESNSISELQYYRRKLKDFRMKLAYDKRTESFESTYDWAKEFNEIESQLDL